MFKQILPDRPQQLETLMSQSTIDASLFLPFTTFRLRPYAVNRQVELTVEMHGTRPERKQTHRLQLTWRPTSDTLMTPPVQEHIVTEWAACGVALAVIPLYTPYRVVEVARIGDSFDYWLGQDIREVGLEISGTMRGDLTTRTQEKQRQLINNPYQSHGYVCVVGFEKQAVRLSFFRDET